MEDHDIMIDQNRDMLLKQNQYLEPGHSQSSVLVHSHDFGLAHINDQNLDADIEIDFVQELGLDETGLILHETNEHDLIQQQEDIHNFKENQIDFDRDDKADVHQSLTTYEDHENHFIDQKFGVGSLENNELAVVDYHNFNATQEMGIVPISNANFPPPVAVRHSELAVGQEFPDVHSCRRALRDAAIAFQFEMQTVKSDKTRFTAKCASEGCPWRIHAAKLPGVPTFTIRTIHEEHTCSRIAHPGHLQASVQWVTESMEQHLKENPHCTPKEILEEIYRVYGITLSYKQAWRAKERFMATVRGSFEEEYRLLPQYCDQIRKTNPGSIAVIYGNPVDNCFERLFISFQASIYGFLNACQPIIGLERALLRNKYLGTFLFATGFDGDGAAFPLAFGVVDYENDDNWMWFIAELHNLLETNTENMPNLTILSDRQKGIVIGIEVNFPTAFHGFYMHHLIDSFQKQFNNTILVNLLWEAAKVLTQPEFVAKILMIDEMSEAAGCWVRSINPRLWATAYSEGTGIGQITANVAELLNTLILESSALPIVQMMECIRRHLMILFNERREKSLQWTSALVPSAESQVSEAVERARSCKVLKANDAEFEVISDEGSHIVNICKRQCLCRGWQLQGLPCVHAVAALISCRQNVFRFAESCFTVAQYRKAYSQTIHPIPDKALWRSPSEGSQAQEFNDAELIVSPPKSLQLPPGKPRKKRPRAEDAGRVKRTVHCSRCHQTGHFRTTCTVPI